MGENQRTSEDEGALPPGVDLAKASAARAYDYLLGGAHNFEVDRVLAHRLEEVAPDVAGIARDNRAFLGRAVQLCLDHGVRQFLDLGSGVPAADGVYGIAQRVDPDSRVVHVDKEPVAVAHGVSMLSDDDRVAVVQGDVTEPDAVLQAAEGTGLLDFDEPIAVMMVALLHFVPDAADPAAIVRRFRESTVGGSYFCFSHLTADEHPATVRSIVDVHGAAGGSGPVPRTWERVLEIAGDVELVEPGLVPAPSWRPDHVGEVGSDPGRALQYVGVGTTMSREATQDVPRRDTGSAGIVSHDLKCERTEHHP